MRTCFLIYSLSIKENLKKSIADANKTIDALMKQIGEIQKEDQEKYNKLKKDLEEESETMMKKLEEKGIIDKL